MKAPPEDKILELLGEQVSNVLPETISGLFRSAVSKIAGTRSESNRAFVIILLGCVWAIALRGRRESEVAKDAMESTFATTLKRLKVLVDANRLVPISMQWTTISVAIISPIVLIASSWFMVFKTHDAAFSKLAGDSSGFSIYQPPGKDLIYGIYSPGGPPKFESAEQTGWYRITPVTLPPPLKPPK